MTDRPCSASSSQSGIPTEESSRALEKPTSSGDRSRRLRNDQPIDIVLAGAASAGEGAAPPGGRAPLGLAKNTLASTGAPAAKQASAQGQENEDRGEVPTRARTAARPAHDPRSHEDVPIGVVHLDGQPSANMSIGVVVTEAGRAHFRRDVYVGIRDADQNLEFLGRVVEGPFYRGRSRTEEADTDARSRYFVHGTVELLGEIDEGGRLLASSTRPRPGASVNLFADRRLQHFLRVDGDLYLGHLTGHEGVRIAAPSQSKNFLPRNVGIFGTVGSGKSNTAQVLIEEALTAGWAVVLVDLEGEYARMNEPTDDPQLVRLLRETYALPPKGVEDFRVYVPACGRSGASSAQLFKVPMAGLDPEIVADILALAETEARVFDQITTQATRLYTTATAGPDDRPYTLQHLLDGLIEGAPMNGHPTFRLLPQAREHDLAPASVLRTKLQNLARSELLDTRTTAHVPELPLDDLLAGGRLSVLDLSETDDRSRNLAMAYMLQELFERVVATPMGQPMASGAPRPPLLVVIEEVHTFVSRAAAPKMRAVLDRLQIITRRGRKRWMAMALVSQQPNHVPDEIFELTNTRFIHQLKSTTNLEPVRQTTSSVDESLWDTVAALGAGQCLLTGAAFKMPLFVSVRPARSRRLMVS